MQAGMRGMHWLPMEEKWGALHDAQQIMCVHCIFWGLVTPALAGQRVDDCNGGLEPGWREDGVESPTIQRQNSDAFVGDTSDGISQRSQPGQVALTDS
jgi:hypothetical protein